MERVIPLSRRKGDIIILAFFWLNILFITYIVDVEQIVLPDISGDWEYPLWPPSFFVVALITPEDELDVISNRAALPRPTKSLPSPTKDECAAPRAAPF